MATHHSVARIEGAENRRKVTLQRVFHVSEEALWSALVEPDSVRAWFAPAKIDPRVGGRESPASEARWQELRTEYAKQL